MNRIVGNGVYAYLSHGARIWAAAIVLVGLCGCPRPSLTVRVVNTSEDMSVVSVQLYDGNGARSTNDLLRGRDVEPQGARSVSLPLSETEGAVGIVFDVADAADNSPLVAVSEPIDLFEEDTSIVISVGGTIGNPSWDVAIEE